MRQNVGAMNGRKRMAMLIACTVGVAGRSSTTSGVAVTASTSPDSDGAVVAPERVHGQILLEASDTLTFTGLGHKMR